MQGASLRGSPGYGAGVLWASLFLVLAAVGWFVRSATAVSPELLFGYEQLIHARIPWLLLGALWLGAMLGLLSLRRGRRWFHYPVLGVELLLAGGLSFYMLAGSFLPESELRVEVGDAFPSYALLDQDERLHNLAAGEPRKPALYVFYRGDW
ncbi:MAG: hypothetical protein AAEJ53_04220 [Myxococcota bacterium]